MLFSITPVERLAFDARAWTVQLTVIQAGDKTKISRTTLEGRPEVWVLVFARVDNATVAENNLEVNDRVACPATPAGAKRVLYQSCYIDSVGATERLITYTTTSGETTNADNRSTSTMRHNAVGASPRSEGHCACQRGIGTW